MTELGGHNHHDVAEGTIRGQTIADPGGYGPFTGPAAGGDTLWGDHGVRGPHWRQTGFANRFEAQWDEVSTADELSFFMECEAEEHVNGRGWCSIADSRISGNPMFLCQCTTTTIRFYINGGYRYTHSALDISDGRHTVGATMNQSHDWVIYVDGIYAATYSGLNTTHQANAIAFFPGSGFNGHISGQYYNIRMYDRVLSPSEMAALHHLSYPDYVERLSKPFMVPVAGGGLSIPVAMHSYRMRRAA